MQYHFVTRDSFLALVDQKGFIEHAEFSGNLYGTSIQAVKDIADLGKRCILDIEVQVGLSSLLLPLLSCCSTYTYRTIIPRQITITLEYYYDSTPPRHTNPTNPAGRPPNQTNLSQPRLPLPLPTLPLRPPSTSHRPRHRNRSSRCKTHGHCPQRDRVR